jgi:hypothetical protein
MVALGHGYPFVDTDDTLALKALIVERQGLVAMRAQTKARVEAHTMKKRAVGKRCMTARREFLPCCKKKYEVLNGGFCGITRRRTSCCAASPNWRPDSRRTHCLRGRYGSLCIT